MRQIVTHFTDNDLYTFSVQYYVMQTYPRAEIEYTFFDRNNTVYPRGFADLLMEQVEGMRNVVLTDEEYLYMREKLYYFPDWYFTFLKGYRFNPDEVGISQDGEGRLSIKITGKWYSAIMWEMPILSTISELMHIYHGEVENVDYGCVRADAYQKGLKAFYGGIALADMGTRRRFSFDVQERVLGGLKDAYTYCENDLNALGAFNGTSNVWFAKEFGLTPIGTCSHQAISAEECVSGLFECNFAFMDKWAAVYHGNLGIMLYDCFTDKVFFNNFTKKHAKLFDGLRVDSGDEKEQTEKIIARYKELGIDPRTKSVIYSNALTIEKAIELHKWIGGRVKDSYGIGTHLCADVTNTKTGEKFPYSNIVIKATKFRITESREWQNCVKLSNDSGKMLGDMNKCHYLLSQINREQ